MDLHLLGRRHFQSFFSTRLRRQWLPVSAIPRLALDSASQKVITGFLLWRSDFDPIRLIDRASATFTRFLHHPIRAMPSTNPTDCKHREENGQGLACCSSGDEAHEVVTSLQVCAKRRDLTKGSSLHLDIVNKGLLKTNPAVGNTLMDMYAKCGRLEKAQNVFDALHARNVASWTILIAAYVQYGHAEVALNLFRKMVTAGYTPNGVTYACILKACGHTGALGMGEEIHEQIQRRGLLPKDVVLANSLVHMYAKNGALAKAQKVFDSLQNKTIEAWTALISGYAQHENSEAALKCYTQMRRHGLLPNAITFVCILKACGNMRALDVAQEIHEQIENSCLLERNVVVGNALLDAYAKCGRLRTAEGVFQKISAPNVVTWTTLIAGYVQHGYGMEALCCFEQMQVNHVSPNVVTYVCALKACGIVRALDKGLKIHAQVDREVLLKENGLVITALVYMYTRCSMLECAKEVFNKSSHQDVTLWTTLIAGHVQNDRLEEAIQLFEKMLQAGITPSAATYSCILKACAILGVAEKGHKIFPEAERLDFLKEDVVLMNAVLGMYAKTGFLEKACGLFYELPAKDLVSWNTLIAGNINLGNYELAVTLFNQMLARGLMPDQVTFNLMLEGCNNAGLIDDAEFLFNMITAIYGIVPTVEHHVSMVDLFGCAGQADKAVSIFNKMPFSTNAIAWHSVMADCHKWSHFGI